MEKGSFQRVARATGAGHPPPPMDWRVKGFVQKGLSLAPGGAWLNDLLQLTLGLRRDLDRQISSKVDDDWCVLLEHMAELGVEPAGLAYLEIGTGWHPVLPICYALAGARSCHTYDLTRHLDARYTRRMLAALGAHVPTIARAGHRPLAEVEATYAHLQGATGLDDLLRRARIEYHAPADAARTGLEADSLDVVYSNNVLEHVPPDVILQLMRESLRVLRPGGLAIHCVNCGDHYAYFDRAITQLNYLSFTEREWGFWNNGLHYQNRLRPHDLVGIVERAGLEIVLERRRPDPRLVERLPGMRIAPEFRKYPPEQLASTSVAIVARKPGSAAPA
jgi:Methyltransferase domain